MKVTKELYKMVEQEKLLLDHFYLIYLIKEKQEIPEKLRSYILLLQKKGYIDENQELTDKAELLLASIPSDEILEEKITDSKEEPKKQDFSDYCKYLHSELKKRHKELTGKDNKNLYGNKYLIPAVSVIEKRLKEAAILYKFNIDEKVLEVLKQHIEKCVNTKYEKVRTIEYLILGQNSKSSDLATCLDNYEEFEEVQEFNSQQKFV